MNESSSIATSGVLRRIRSLTERKARDRAGHFWIEGVRNFLHAFEWRAGFESVVVSDVLLRNGTARKVMRRLRSAGVPCVAVTPEQFRAVSAAEHVSGIGAILRQRWVPLAEARTGGLCWLIVEQIGSPGNLGTIVRTAEAVGASGVVFVGPQGDPYHPTVVRASMGGLFALDYVRASFVEFADWVSQRRLRLVGLSPSAAAAWTELAVDREIALVVGEERNGITPRMAALCDTSLRLPMSGRADSLNVAVATGVMLYELVRRRS